MNSKIENITIENFKSIQHQKIEGCKKINVFIGYPNVGKSNILEAISSLGVLKKNGNNFEFQKLCRYEAIDELFFNFGIEKPAVVQYDVAFRVEITPDVNNAIAIKKQYLNIDNLWTSLLDYSSEDTHIDLNDIKNNDKFSVLKYDFSSVSKKDSTEQFFTNLKSPNGENLFKILESNAELRKALIDLLSDYGLKLMFEKGTKYTMRIIKTLIDGTIIAIPFHQIADTLQRLIFYKAAILTNKDTVLLFEEPEAHMFPPYIRKFTSDIIFDKTNQFFIATHSPYVLDELIEEAPNDVSVYLVDYKNGETIIKTLTNEKLQEIREYGVDLFFNVESYLKHE
jgi:AAA15 family ATPase/GTPase